MTTSTAVASTLFTAEAREALQGCTSLRNLHDVAKTLIKSQQLGLDFDPKRKNAFDMPVALLFCRIEDSIRDELDEDAIRGFADSYIAGDDVPALSVVAENGMLRVAEGFARYAGLQLAIAEGAPIKRVWVNQVDSGRRNEIRIQLVSNQQVPLTAQERASAYRELLDDGCSVTEIAGMVRRKVEHVRKLLDYSQVEPEVKAMVKAGQASVGTVVKASRQCKAEGTSTVVYMKDQLAKAHANGSNKITPKSTAAPAAFYNPTDLNASIPLLIQIAEGLEQAIPFMGKVPEQVNLQLTLNGDLQALLISLANLRAAHSAVQGAEPLAKAS